ncbi:phage tail protein I [Microbulbifer sp. PSTR4-B]|uniref:phage tail protein I n=1 Tax=unclassified Microbulbifer TaxID=2619833 RepID=UPI00403A7D2A
MTDTLLPPNATELELAVERAMAARLDAIPVNITDLHNPDKCPPAFLPFLAWQRSVDTWNDTWPEATKRAVVRAAFETHTTKGTRAAVETAAGAFGGDVAIVEWFQKTPPGPPYTFELVLNAVDRQGQPVSAGFQQDIIKAVTYVKPLRAHFDVRLGVQANAKAYTFGVARVATFTRLKFNAA